MNDCCTVEGCMTVEKWLARGMCGKHYTRWRKYGDPHQTGPAREPLVIRVWQLVDTSAADGCWPWTGSLNSTGYGLSDWVDAPHVLAHRTVFELVHGPVPGMLDLDHLCHTNDSACPGGIACMHRRCVNPDHLEPVTRAENGRRQGPRLTECRRGHAFTAENTGINPTTGTRFCRTCSRATKARSRAKVGVA